MKLTEKDHGFLLKLKTLVEEKNLSIELKDDGLRRFVLRRNYGSYIESAFKMSRQGIRWRFQRLFNEVYVNSYISIYWLESTFGTELRHMAITIARDQVAFRRKAKEVRIGHGL